MPETDKDGETPLSKAFQKLLNKRENLVNAITNHESKTREGQMSRSMATSRLDSLEHTYKKYQTVMDNIIEHDDYDPKHLTVSNNTVEDRYHEAVTAYKEILNPDKNDAVSLNSTISNREHEYVQKVKLPTVSIPKFDGNLLKWTTFYDTFSSLVHENQNIPCVSKMIYLKENLSGPAFRCISKLPVSEANYKLAWKILQENFHDKRAIVNDCLKSFLFQEPMKSPSANEIRDLIDTTREAIQCIETLDVEVEDWDPFLVFILQTKLDKETANDWERKLGGTKEIPKYSTMLDFLETQHRIYSTPMQNLPSTSTNTQKTAQKIHATKLSNNEQRKKDHCEACDGEHYILFCDKFNAWPIEQRKKFVTDNELCLVCLKRHSLESCNSKFRCKTCQGRHSTKLHESNTRMMAMNLTEPSTKREKLLATAVVLVHDRNGAKHLLRAVIDQGSEGSVISERAFQLLRLPQKREDIPLTGLDNQPLGKAKKTVRIRVQSAVNSAFEMSMESLVMRSVVSPGFNFENRYKSWKHLNNLRFADPEYMKPKRADLLFGVDICGIIIKNGLRKGKHHEPIAQNSELGWLIFGAACKEKDFSVRIHTSLMSSSSSLDDELKRFWETEEVEIPKIMTEEHQQCVEFCKATTKCLDNGQIQVSLPFNANPNDTNFLGDSRKMALKRFYHLEKKFEREPEYFERYKEDMLSYLQNNHMSLSKSPFNEGFHVPHHGVVREQSTTTKQRTVFDASAKTSNKLSLNDRLLNGPTIQPDLFDIFIRWRMFFVALVADLEKMYRQVSLAPEDRKYQKILFRFSKEEPIQTYEISTVMFGVKPAPYLAINATFFIADMEKTKFPVAAERVKTDFYVDDGMSGANSVPEAKQLQRELNQMFNCHHMRLRKWASNKEEALDGIPLENRAIDHSLTLQTAQTVKTLGMKWTPSADVLSFTLDLSQFSHEDLITKRKLVSDASKLYDPCGLLAPITVKAKILMQNAFKAKVNWDAHITNEIQKEWNEYRNALPSIKSIKIDRWLRAGSDSVVSLHGFCDSSIKAFAAAIYLVQTSNEITTSSLVCAKTRVAPIHPVSIPRLELCGAVLLAQLMARIAKNLQIEKPQIHLWSDSAVVLTWLQSHASRWKTYISHRVNKIQKNYPAQYWRHVRTHENPADLASRGVLPSELVNNKLWFNGPDWLLLSQENWPKILPILAPNIQLEEQIRINVINEPPEESEILCRFSDFIRLLRVTARVLRFIDGCLKRKKEPRPEYITVPELNRAKFIWIKIVQSFYFSREINDLQKHGIVNEKSSLKQLTPTMRNDMLAVQGRLAYAEMRESQKFPIILPDKSHLSKLIIDFAHRITLHGTIHSTLARVRQEFWILNGRNAVKSHIHRCLPCFRQRPKRSDQLMAPLPTIKTKPTRAFLHCGLDFAGPIEIKSSNKRNAPTEKGYICVFVCMASKAAHLELVGDLSTQKFILAVRRMMGRRGLSSDFYCDQGTNFQGASNELPRLFFDARATETKEIINEFAADRIQFHFNPPGAPSWGGQWEAFVKLTKHNLRRMTTSVKLTYEEMSTLLVQIEACLNSRPLCALTSDKDDLDPLTPGHLLIGDPLNLIPEPSLLSLKDNTLDRFQAIQKSVQLFWKRFYGEYLHTQHPRKKWYKPNEDICVGDLVVVIDDNLPPAKWRMARVTEVHAGRDGYVRMVTLKTQHSTLQRPIVKLCKLPAPEDVPVMHTEQNK